MGGNRRWSSEWSLYPPIMPMPGEAISDRESNKRQLVGHDTWLVRGQGSPSLPAFSLLQLGQLECLLPATYQEEPGLSGLRRSNSSAVPPPQPLLPLFRSSIPHNLALKQTLNLMSLRLPTLLFSPREECSYPILCHFIFTTVILV